MVIGPATLMLVAQGEQLTEQGFGSMVEVFSQMWNDVRKLASRNLGRNRFEYMVRPDPPLCRELDFYAQALAAAGTPSSGDRPIARAEELRDRNSGFIVRMLEYNQWLASEGQFIDFDYEKYEAKAVMHGQKYWAPTVREFSRP